MLVLLALLDLEEHQVKCGLEVLIVLTRFRKGEEREKRGHVVVLCREPVTEKRDERRVEHLLRVLPERVTARFPLGVRVHNEAVHEGEDIGIRLHVL